MSNQNYKKGFDMKRLCQKFSFFIVSFILMPSMILVSCGKVASETSETQDDGTENLTVSAQSTADPFSANSIGSLSVLDSLDLAPLENADVSVFDFLTGVEHTCVEEDSDNTSLKTDEEGKLTLDISCIDEDDRSTLEIVFVKKDENTGQALKVIAAVNYADVGESGTVNADPVQNSIDQALKAKLKEQTANLEGSVDKTNAQYPIQRKELVTALINMKAVMEAEVETLDNFTPIQAVFEPPTGVSFDEFDPAKPEHAIDATNALNEVDTIFTAFNIVGDNAVLNVFETIATTFIETVPLIENAVPPAIPVSDKIKKKDFNIPANLVPPKGMGFRDGYNLPDNFVMPENPQILPDAGDVFANATGVDISKARGLTMHGGFTMPDNWADTLPEDTVVEEGVVFPPDTEVVLPKGTRLVGAIEQLDEDFEGEAAKFELDPNMNFAFHADFEYRMDDYSFDACAQADIAVANVEASDDPRGACVPPSATEVNWEPVTEWHPHAHIPTDKEGFRLPAVIHDWGAGIEITNEFFNIMHDDAVIPKEWEDEMETAFAEGNLHIDNRFMHHMAEGTFELKEEHKQHFDYTGEHTGRNEAFVIDESMFDNVAEGVENFWEDEHLEYLHEDAILTEDFLHAGHFEEGLDDYVERLDDSIENFSNYEDHFVEQDTFNSVKTRFEHSEPFHGTQCLAQTFQAKDQVTAYSDAILSQQEKAKFVVAAELLGSLTTLTNETLSVTTTAVDSETINLGTGVDAVITDNGGFNSGEVNGIQEVTDATKGVAADPGSKVLTVYPAEDKEGGVKLTFATPVDAIAMDISGLEIGKRPVRVEVTYEDGSIEPYFPKRNQIGVGGTAFMGAITKSECSITSLEIIEEFFGSSENSKRDIFSIDNIAYSVEGEFKDPTEESDTDDTTTETPNESDVTLTSTEILGKWVITNELGGHVYYEFKSDNTVNFKFESGTDSSKVTETSGGWVIAANEITVTFEQANEAFNHKLQVSEITDEKIVAVSINPEGTDNVELLRPEGTIDNDDALDITTADIEGKWTAEIEDKDDDGNVEKIEDIAIQFNAGGTMKFQMDSTMLPDEGQWEIVGKDVKVTFEDEPEDAFSFIVLEKSETATKIHVTHNDGTETITLNKADSATEIFVDVSIEDEDLFGQWLELDVDSKRFLEFDKEGKFYTALLNNEEKSAEEEGTWELSDSFVITVALEDSDNEDVPDYTIVEIAHDILIVTYDKDGNTLTKEFERFDGKHVHSQATVDDAIDITASDVEGIWTVSFDTEDGVSTQTFQLNNDGTSKLQYSSMQLPAVGVWELDGKKVSLDLGGIDDLEFYFLVLEKSDNALNILQSNGNQFHEILLEKADADDNLFTVLEVEAILGRWIDYTDFHKIEGEKRFFTFSDNGEFYTKKLKSGEVESEDTGTYTFENNTIKIELNSSDSETLPDYTVFYTEDDDMMLLYSDSSGTHQRQLQRDDSKEIEDLDESDAISIEASDIDGKWVAVHVDEDEAGNETVETLAFEFDGVDSLKFQIGNKMLPKDLSWKISGKTVDVFYEHDDGHNETAFKFIVYDKDDFVMNIFVSHGDGKDTLLLEKEADDAPIFQDVEITEDDLLGEWKQSHGPDDSKEVLAFKAEGVLHWDDEATDEDTFDTENVWSLEDNVISFDLGEDVEHPDYTIQEIDEDRMMIIFGSDDTEIEFTKKNESEDS